MDKVKKLFGGLIQVSNPVKVSWSWEDQQQGLVTWTFENTTSEVQTVLLQRGAEQNGVQFEDYIFGQAFWAIYTYNPQFATSFMTKVLPSPNGTPQMAVVKSSNGMFVAFVFVLEPNSTYTMIEGGFSNGVQPSNPVVIPVVTDGKVYSYSVTYQSNQCQGYNQQSGTNFPCPPDPYTINSIVFTTNQTVPIFEQDTFVPSQQETACNALANQIIQNFDSGNYWGMLSYVLQYIENGCL